VLERIWLVIYRLAFPASTRAHNVSIFIYTFTLTPQRFIFRPVIELTACQITLLPNEKMPLLPLATFFQFHILIVLLPLEYQNYLYDVPPIAIMRELRITKASYIIWFNPPLLCLHLKLFILPFLRRRHTIIIRFNIPSWLVPYDLRFIRRQAIVVAFNRCIQNPRHNKEYHHSLMHHRWRCVFLCNVYKCLETTWSPGLAPSATTFCTYFGHS